MLLHGIDQVHAHAILHPAGSLGVSTDGCGQAVALAVCTHMAGAHLAHRRWRGLVSQLLAGRVNMDYYWKILFCYIVAHGMPLACAYIHEGSLSII